MKTESGKRKAESGKRKIENGRLRILFFFFIFHFTFFIFPQKAQRVSDLASTSPSWYTVIGGEAVSPCIETSYGVALLSDGRLLSACTNSGNVIWQRSIKGRPSPYISSFGDFLFVATDRTHLNFVNPSGMTLWTVVCPFEITDFPVVARDGRVFVRGKKGVACYGLDGKRKWHAETDELGNLPIGILNDGSLVLFLKNPKNKQTVVARFSAFGERLEDITFSAIVTSVASCEKGVLVSLTNGSLGLVTVQNETADSIWVNGSGSSLGAFKICYSENTGHSAFFFQNGSRTETVIVETDSGEILSRFQVGAIAPKDFKLARATEHGFFISGAYTACEFSEDGTILYAASLPDTSKWNSLFYTKKNYIILCMKDWTMKAYLMNENLQSAAVNSEKTKKNSISFVDSAHFDTTSLSLGIRPLTNQKMAQISKDFEEGDYGVKEKEYLSLIKTEAKNYIDSCKTASAFRGEGEANFFSENAVYTQNLLYVMSKTGTREFSLFFSDLLSSEMDSSQILSVITFAGDAGYDEDGKMLLALQKLTMKSTATDAVVLKAICDATYKICRFMGRPALNKRGKDILSYMFLPQFDKNINTYARKTLEKMIDLEKKR